MSAKSIYNLALFLTFVNSFVNFYLLNIAMTVSHMIKYQEYMGNEIMDNYIKNQTKGHKAALCRYAAVRDYGRSITSNFRLF